MVDSFVTYRSFHEALSNLSREMYGNIMFAINEYALNGVEPDFTGVEKAIFVLIKPQLDANIRRRENGMKGGNKSAQPKQAEPIQREAVQETVLENPEPEVQPEEIFQEPVANECAELLVSEPQTKMAKQIHEVFEENNLPCTPFVSFIQGEFMRGIKMIHSRYRTYKLTSDDIVQTCRNYAAVINDNNDYFDKKMPFDRFVEHPKFLDFVPSSFVKSNWRKWGVATEPEKEEKQDDYDDVKIVPPIECPECKKVAMRWTSKRQIYECTSCRCQRKWLEINTWAKSSVCVG